MQVGYPLQSQSYPDDGGQSPALTKGQPVPLSCSFISADSKGKNAHDIHEQEITEVPPPAEHGSLPTTLPTAAHSGRAE